MIRNELYYWKLSFPINWKLFAKLQNRILKMKVVYKSNVIPDTQQIIELYNSSGQRPTRNG